MEHLERVTRKLLRYVFKLTIVLMATVQLKTGFFLFLSNVKYMSS